MKNTISNTRKRNILVNGVGVNDFEGRVNVAGKSLPEYSVWKSMLQRCYAKKSQGQNPAYVGCSVAEEWYSFSNFYRWLHQNNWEKGLHIDKDLLIEGNKVYGPDTCCLVPQAINKLLLDSARARGSYPQGVSFHKLAGKYLAKVSENGKLKHLGYFNTIEEAERAYKDAKAIVILNTVSDHIGRLTQPTIDALVSKALLLRCV